MKIAAIDLGSNSLHMVIVEINASGGFRVVDRETAMVRLGSGSLTTRVLTRGAMSRAMTTLKAYRRLAQTHEVEEVVAVATSAIREADNGEDFLDRIGKKTGIWARVISGEEEARLDYLAALHSIHLEGGRALVIDIGGGSVQLAVGRGKKIELAISEQLGARRMTERFVGSDPLSPRDEKRLKDHVKKTIAPHLERIGKAKLDHVVGASGTILALGRLAYEVETGQKPESLHHVTLDAGSFRTVKERLLKTDLEDRMKMPGLDKRRVDIIVAGAVVLDTLLKRMNVRKLLLSEWALREGLLLDYISRHRATLVRAGAHPDVRRRSVLEFAERYLHDDPHARHVAHLALALFDGTGRIHGLDKRQRTLLEYSALLHGVGHHISHSQHHLHTYYLIKHGDLRGFDPLEIEIMANVARYHRRGRPRKKHDAYAALPASQRRAVRVLAGLLQLADALDRSHRQRIRSLRVVKSAGGLKVRCTAEGNVDLEKWGAGRRTDLLERALDTKILIEMVRPGKRPAGKGEAE